MEIHFIHQFSNRRDAISILLLHGWSSSSLEWAKVIPGLANPKNASLPGFNVVAPDLPGYGFSPAPKTPGPGAKVYAVVFDNLMQQLGCDRYAIYTTDLGSTIARRLCDEHEDRVINHVTDFYFLLPNATDEARLASNETTAEEIGYINSINAFLAQHSAYASLDSSFPLSIAHALWYIRSTIDFQPPTVAEEMIRRTLTLYIPGPYGNLRSYKELFGEFVTYAEKTTSVPTSISQRGGLDHYSALANANFAPRRWIERVANVTYFKGYPKGGHFPAEHPEGDLFETMNNLYGMLTALWLGEII